jgi:hypothetical protein
MNRGHDDYMIHEISVMADVPEHEVLAKFKMTLAFMDAKARIHDFLPLLAMNQVRSHYMTSTLAKREHENFLRSQTCTLEDKYFQTTIMVPITPH